MGKNKDNKKLLSKLSFEKKEESLEKVKKKANATRIVLVAISATLVITALVVLIVNHFVK